MDHWLTANELAGLPGLPASPKTVRAWLAAASVPSRPRVGRGGGVEFDAAALPERTRQAVLKARAPHATPAAPMTTARQADRVPALAGHRREPTDVEKACGDARAILVRRLADIAPMFAGSIRHAAGVLAQQLSSPSATAGEVELANAANRCSRVAAVSERSLRRWYAAWLEGGWWALIPAPAPVPAPLADDVASVLREYSSASGAARNLTHCAQRVTDALGRPYDEWRLLYDRARRALPKLDKTRLIKARHTGAERAAKLPFKRRDTGTIAVLDVAVVDGHTFKAKVAHPDHGAPFAPEVTIVMDAKTRRITGWSASLSENTIAVGDALRHAVSQHGVPAMVYSDNGAGERAKAFDCPVAGLFARLGVEHRTGIPGHPQGHGIIERSWQTHMLRCARQFATYQGRDADSRTVRNMRLALERDQRALKRTAETGEVVRLNCRLPSWRQFLEAVAATVADYNGRHRHRALPKNAAGLHMTPDEAWAAMLVPSDQALLDGPALRHIFMPAALRVAQRGEVRFLNQAYAAGELMQVDGERLRVHYDIHDASRVWVWTVDGRFVCEAVCGANAMGYMPKAAVDLARERRTRGIVKRREQQIDLARAELSGSVDAAEPMPLLAPAEAWEPFLEPLQAPAEAVPAQAPARPFFDAASDRYAWLLEHRDAWLPADAAWLAAYVASDDYAVLSEYYAARGLDWPDDAAFKRAG